MADTNYTYTISTDFPNGKVATDRLAQELRVSTIITALQGIYTNGDTCVVTFKAALSAEDRVILDGNQSPPSVGSIIGDHSGIPLPAETIKVDIDNVELTTDKRMAVSSEKAEGDRRTFVTPNFCDKTTWYFESEKQTGMALTDSGDHTTYNDPSDTAPWIDNAHGKYFKEDFLLTAAGDLPRMIVYVNGTPQTETDAHDNVGDYTVDYASGTVTFSSALAAEDVVTTDTWKVTTSSCIYAPSVGTVIKLDSVEIQLTENVAFTDTIIYQTYVYNPYDLPNRIPYGDPDKYKTMWDLISESNRAYPQMHPSTNPVPAWRNPTLKINTLVWDFKATIAIPSSVGAQIHMSLEHDVPFGGTLTTVTLYGREYPEE